MKKHIFIIAVHVLCCCSFVCAQTVPPVPQKIAAKQKSAILPSRSVTYRVGVGIAAEYASIDVRLKNMPIDSIHGELYTNQIFASDAHHMRHKFQISPGFELGAFIAEQYYVGLAWNKHYAGASNRIKTSIGEGIYFDHQLKLRSYTDLFLKFGYKIIPKVLFYGLVGPSFANWSHDSTMCFCGELQNEVYHKSKMNNKTTGFGFGGGIEYAINEKYSINMEYTINIHKMVCKNYQAGYISNREDPVYGFYDPQLIDARVQKSVRLSYSTIGLRFSYFFSF